MSATNVISEADEHRRWERLEAVLDDRPSLIGAAGEAVELPSSALALLREGISLLRGGGGVALLPASADISAHEAADILNVRDDYLETLLVRGDLPSSESGGERRIPLGALLAYKQKRDAERLHNLDELVREGQEDGSYEREWKEGW